MYTNCLRMVYVNFHRPICHRDFSMTVFVIKGVTPYVCSLVLAIVKDIRLKLRQTDIISCNIFLINFNI